MTPVRIKHNLLLYFVSDTLLMFDGSRVEAFEDQSVYS